MTRISFTEISNSCFILNCVLISTSFVIDIILVMNILQIHNFYQQPGGEDRVFHSETSLLRSGGHSVIQYTLYNDQINYLSKAALFRKTIWNTASYHEVEQLIIQNKPDVCHFHNFFPLISPSAYYACQKNHVPVVQTLHNYRLICLNALLLREGSVCEDCVHKIFPLPGVLHGCYHQSKAASFVVAAMLGVHRLLGTWSRQVDTYIALTEFAKKKFVEGGLPAKKIVVKPNFVISNIGLSHSSQYALFVGRLSVEKGIMSLLEAWKNLDHVPLKIIGDGPLFESAKKYIGRNCLGQIELLGSRTSDEVFRQIKRASFLVFPSICYENFPLTVVEAFSYGVPVISSQLGAPTDIIENHRTGLFFQPGNAQDLAEKVKWAWDNKTIMEEMGNNARLEYESKYTAEKNLHALEDIYKQTIENYKTR